jgi:hypothetical protein
VEKKKGCLAGRRRVLFVRERCGIGVLQVGAGRAVLGWRGKAL